MRHPTSFITAAFLVFGTFGCHAPASPAPAAQPPAAPRPLPLVLADFENGVPSALTLTNGKGETNPDTDASNRYLHLTPAETFKPLTLRFNLPEHTDLSQMGTINARLRLKGPGEQVNLRIYAVDRQNRNFLTSTLKIPPSDQWSSFVEPLSDFRFLGNGGPWKEATALLFVFQANIAQADIDDVGLIPATPETPPKPTPEIILKLAFPGPTSRPVRTLEKDGLFIATDAPDDGRDLPLILDRTKRAKAFIQRVFAPALQPIDDEYVTFLFFSSLDARVKWFESLEKLWHVKAPRAPAGLAIGNTATAFYDPKLDADRPVFVHESIHALIAQQLRIPSGVPAGNWLQEGTANYVQLCTYPKALNLNVYPTEFRAASKDIAKSRFIPLEKLFKNVDNANYAQAAIFIAFLVETHPKLLNDLTIGLREGIPPAQTLQSHNLTFEGLQTQWLEWGSKKFEKPRSDGRHLDVLPEFRDLQPGR